MEDFAAQGLRPAGLVESVHSGTTGCATSWTVGRATRRTDRWTSGSADGRRGYISMDIEAPRPWSQQPE